MIISDFAIKMKICHVHDFISGFEKKEHDRLHFVYKDAIFPSEKHQGKMFYLQKASIIVKCHTETVFSKLSTSPGRANAQDYTCMFEKLEVNGEVVENLTEAGSFLCMLHIVSCHTPIHVYGLKIAAFLHRETLNSSVIENMFSAACGLAEAAYWYAINDFQGSLHQIPKNKDSEVCNSTNLISPISIVFLFQEKILHLLENKRLHLFSKRGQS